MFRILCFPLLALSLVAARVVVAEDYKLPDTCMVDLVDDIELHATESGVLDFLAVKEGARVRAEDVLVKINTSQVEKAKEIARYKLNAAIARYRDDIEKRYAEAAANVALATVAELEETNSIVDGAVTQADLRQARLDHKRALLQIDKAVHDQKLAKLDAEALLAEYQAAELAVDRRTLRSPFDGVVVEKFRDEKEWVNPGDPILRLVRLNELQVEGMVPIEQYTPAELDGCEVTIQVRTKGGRPTRATGRIVFVMPELLRGQKAVVRAEITNREENGHWTILPQMTAEMTIHIGTGGVAVGAR